MRTRGIRLKRYIAELERLLKEHGNLHVYKSGMAGYGGPAPLPSIRYATSNHEIWRRNPAKHRKSAKIVVVDRYESIDSDNYEEPD